jgi:hypothetical protein
MSDERMSRRARRELDETGEATTGAIPTPGDGSLTTAQIQAEALSRRDRRRLERVNQPVETWTAEEEMIATGQIPKVTPEVIAQLEREAQLKAAYAQAEAELASAEIRRVSAREVSPERMAEVTGQWPAATPQPDAPQPDAPAAPEPAAEPVAPPPQVVAPEVVAPQPPPVALEPQAPPAEVIRNLFPPGSLQARAFEAQQAQLAAEAAGNSGAAEQPAFGEPAPSGPTPTQAEDDAAAEIRKLTAAAMATIEGASHTEVASHPEGTAATPGVGLQAQAEPAASTGPAAWSAEAAAAKSGQIRRSLPDDADWESTVKGAFITPVFPDEDTANREEPTGLPPLHPLEQQPLAQEPAAQQPAAQELPYQADPVPDEWSVPALADPDLNPLPVRTGGIPRVDPAPPAVEPPVPSLDDVLGGTSGQGVAHPFQQVKPEPVEEEQGWINHPLNDAPVASVDVNAYEPVSDVPTPDFSALSQQAGNPFGPVSTGSMPQVGVTPQSGAVPVVAGGGFSPFGTAPLGTAPVTGATPVVPGGPVLSGGPMTGGTPLVPGAPLSTGSIPVVRREPTLQPAGGVRHYRWTHYALLGALMFVLGVVVYHVVRLNS